MIRVPRVISTALLLAVGVYVGIAVLVFALQGRLLFFPDRQLAATPASFGLPFEDVGFQSEDGVALHGWYLPAQDASRGTVVFFHGNGGNVSHWLPAVLPFRRFGWDVFLFDYRGYGLSQGRPTEQSTYRDAEAAWRYLTQQRRVAPEAMVFVGRSLGGAVATWLAVRHPPRALVLESTFTSVPDVAAGLYPWLPVRLLARFRYNTADRIARVQCPVLIVHSRADEIIPFSHGERLWHLAPEPKVFLEIRGGHNEGFDLSEAEYQAGVASFLTTHAPR